MSDDAVLRCRPIANVVCHALGRALRQQLERGDDDTLTANEVAALRMAIEREDSGALGLLSQLVVASSVEAADPDEKVQEPASQEPVPWGSKVDVASGPGALRQDSALFNATLKDRVVYEGVDVASILRSAARAADIASYHFAPLDSDNVGLLQYKELNSFLGGKLGVQLMDAESHALHDLIDNSLDSIRLTDLVTFLESGGHKACEQFPARVTIERSNTVTTVGVSPDTRRVGCGGMDGTISIYDLDTCDLLAEARFPKPVAALALEVTGVAVGCFGGQLEWLASLPGDVADRATWQLGTDICAVALNDDDGEIAVAAGADVSIFCVRTRDLLYKFTDGGAVLGISLVRFTVTHAELDDAKRTRLVLSSGVEADRPVVSQASRRRSPPPHSPSSLDSGDGVSTPALGPPTDLSFMRLAVNDDDNNDSETPQQLLKQPAQRRRSWQLIPTHRAQTQPTSSDPALRDAVSREALVAGGVMRISNQTQQLMGRVMLDVLDGMPMVCLMLGVVVAIFTITVCQKLGDVPEDSAAASLLDVWMTVAFVFELVLRMLCILQTSHTILKFFANPFYVVDLVVVLIDVALLATDTRDKYGGFPKALRLVRVAQVRAHILRRRMHNRQLARQRRKSRTVVFAEPTRGGYFDEVAYLKSTGDERKIIKYDVDLTCGGTVSNVSRSDVLTASEKEYVEFRQRADREFRECVDRERLPAPYSLLEASETTGSHRNLSLERPLSMRNLRTSGKPRRRGSPPMSKRAVSAHTKGALGERDGMPVTVRLPVRSRVAEVRKYIAFGGESQLASLWTYDATEEQLETTPHHRATTNRPQLVSRSTSRTEEPPSSHQQTSAGDGEGSSPGVEMAVNTTANPLARQEWSMKFEHTVHNVSLSGDARRVAGCARSLVFVYDLDQRCVVFQHTCTDLVYEVALSHTGENVVFGGASREVHLYNVTSGATLYSARSNERVRCVALSRSGKLVAFGGFDSAMHVHHIEYGATGWTGECADVVRSVSLDREGTILAVGGDDCCCHVYSLARAQHCSGKLWTATHAAKVWVVAVEPNARFVAAGDYANAVVVYDATTGEHVWQKTTWASGGAPFTWTVAWSADGSFLAIGHWDSYAYVVHVEDWTETARVKRKDRVYSVALNADASLLCVGGRDKICAVYSLHHLVASDDDARCKTRLSLAFETDEQGGFVYCVAVSHDSRWLAIGSVDGIVSLYWLATKQRRHTIIQEGLIQNLCFSPSSMDLAIASEQNFVEIWQLPGEVASDHDPVTKLVMHRHTSTHAVALSRTRLAHCSGRLFSTYGIGQQSPAWDDRMSFEFLQASLDHARSLDALLRHHPSIVNAQSPLTGESLLQYAVRKKSFATVDQLLSAACHVGLLNDVNGNNALTVALDNERKTILAQLLDATMDMLQASPLVSSSFMDIHADIAEKYPDLYLSFLERVTLVRDEVLVPTNRNFGLMPQACSFITAGSNEHSPERFWDPYLISMQMAFSRQHDHDPTLSPRDDGGRSEAQLRPSWWASPPLKSTTTTTRRLSSLLSYGSGGGPGMSPGVSSRNSESSDIGTLFEKVDGEDVTTELHRRFQAQRASTLTSVKKTEVVALRVPFPYVLGTYLTDGPSQDSVLATALKSSAYLENYSVYSCVLIQCIVQFKWEHYGRFIFLTEFVLCIVHLAIVCVLYFAMLDMLSASWRERANSCRGVAAIVAFGPAVVMSSFFLGIEVRQFLIEGSRSYFAGHKHWKVLDLACFGLQLFVDGLLLSNVTAGVPVLAALNLLCFTSRVTSFARGFEKWGPLVRMIVKIVYEVRFFFGIVLVLILGFLASFAILLQKPPSIWLAIYLANSGLHAHIAEEPNYEPVVWEPHNLAVVLVFHAFLLTIGLLMLNLLIAIMNSAYEEVKASALQEMLHEKSQIILSIERLWLPMLITHYKFPASFFFPRWLLILAPAHHFPERPTATIRQQYRA